MNTLPRHVWVKFYNWVGLTRNGTLILLGS
jgi:hypothetical protein